MGVHQTSSTCDADNPDGFPCEHTFHDILVNTNGNCPEKSIDGLMAATKVMISLDSCVPETYAKMRPGLRLETAMNTAHELIKRGHPDLWIRRVVTEDNKSEPFKEQVDKPLGGKFYKVSEHFCFERGDKKEATAPVARRYCGYPSQRLIVSSDGTCYPCCVDTKGEMDMGRYPEQSLLEIWNGGPFKKLRDELRRNEFWSSACRDCESWLAYNDKRRDSVQDKEIGGVK